MPAWIDEANWPEAWDNIYFSPIALSGSEYIVYVGGYNVQKFYSYNITTQAWTELAAPPLVIVGAMALSPDGTKLVAFSYLGNQMAIYNIAGNSWSALITTPNMTIDGGATANIFASIWTDNDTIWCQVRARINATYYVKCYRYVVSTPAWTQFTNYLTPTTHIGVSMSVNSAGTILYVGGIGDNSYAGLKYIIATDTYSTFTIGSAYRFYWTMDRAAKVWFWDTLTSYTGIFYYDCDLESSSSSIFPYDSERTKPTNLTCGIYGTTYIIAWHRTTEPKNRSYLSMLPPTVTTDPATSVESAAATLNGTLADDGGEACDCGFEWGETSGYGNTTPTQSRTIGQTFAQTITGLDPGKTYHFRAIATNSAGTSYGDDRTFTTLMAAPTVTTDPASAVGQTTATLNGTLDGDGGEACACGFEYGETTDYGAETPTQSKTSGETFSQEVLGLKGGTVYHFRAIATNSVDTSYGADRTFHTEALSAEAHQALGRGYALGRAGL